MPLGNVVDYEMQQKVAATSFVFTWTRPPVAGESCALYIAARLSGTGGTVDTVVDSAGNTWTRSAAETAIAGQNVRGVWWYCLAPAVFTTITVGISASVPCTATLVRMQRMDSVAAPDSTAIGGSGTAAATLSGGALTTSNATDLILYGASFSSTAARTLSSTVANYTPIAFLTGSATLQGSAVVYRATTATVTAQAASVTLSGTTAWTAETIAFKMAADPSGTTVSKTVAASADDAEQASGANDAGRAYGGAGAVTITTTTFSPGSHASNDERSTGARFLNITVPNAATIQKATFRLKCPTTYHSAWPKMIHLLVSAQAADNAATFTTTSDSLNTTARPRTTAVATQWQVTSAVAGQVYALDVTTVVQEIVNRAGWASGNAIVILVDTAADTSVGEWQDWYSWDDATDRTNNPPKLDIIYASGATPVTFTPAIVAAGAVTASVKTTPRLSAAVAGASSATATVRTTPRLAASVVAAGSVSASTRTTPRIAASVVGAATVTAALRSTPRLTSAIVGAASVTTTLRSTPRLAPAVSAASSVTVALRSTPRLTPAVVAASSLAATLRTTPRLTVSVVAASSVSASLGGAVRVSPAVVAAGSVAAQLRTPHLFVPVVSGASAVAVSVRTTPRLAPAATATALVSVAVTTRPLLSPDVAGMASVSVSVSTPHLLSVTVAGVSTITAAVTILLPNEPTVITLAGSDDSVIAVLGLDESVISLAGADDTRVSVSGSDTSRVTLLGTDASTILLGGDLDMATETRITIDLGADTAIVMTVAGSGSLTGTYRASIASRVNPSTAVLSGVPTITDAPGREITWAISDTDTATLLAGTNYEWALWRATDGSEAPLGYGQAILRRLPGSA